ncbi:MAG: hypothetical protein ABJD11_08435 [Gemmatimonadota bacterium]
MRHKNQNDQNDSSCLIVSSRSERLYCVNETRLAVAGVQPFHRDPASFVQFGTNLQQISRTPPEKSIRRAAAGWGVVGPVNRAGAGARDRKCQTGLKMLYDFCLLGRGGAAIL